ncbi:PFL_4695 family integrating conjugative element protein [Motilimonas eburnea]|uniref:PFL_4695 family integrating conjugative element protein n=1 Tax=Motilimonas eburnea TaxID=1737488 RepID=UPI001E4590BC|nr:integrating conjugative element protein [Motilimonas eburnea]
MMRTTMIATALLTLSAANASENSQTEITNTINDSTVNASLFTKPVLTQQQAKNITDEIMKMHRANVVVLHDGGNTTPIERAAKTIDKRAIEKSIMKSAQELKNMKFDASNLTNQVITRFPFHTETLRAGVLPRRHFNKPIPNLVMPLAIVGTDPYSLEWVRLNAAEIERIGASVVVAQANSLDDIRYLRTLLPTALIVPSKADFLVDEFGLLVYPVILNKSGAHQ